MGRKVREIEFDDVQPGPGKAGGARDPWAELISRLMDDQFNIPGTNLRFGLDPLLGLLPVWGDSASALVSLLLLLKSARAGVPRIVLSRMALNILINAAVGALPVGGDLFSFWFKSNAKNYDLHQKHAGTARVSTAKDWLFVGLLLAGVLFVVGLLLLASIGLALQSLRWVFGAGGP